MARKSWMAFLGLGALAVIGIGLWAGRDPIAYADMAVHFAAKQTCSCMHVAGRALDACLTDLPPDAARLVTITPSHDAVSAQMALGLFRARARLAPQGSCVLDS